MGEVEDRWDGISSLNKAKEAFTNMVNSHGQQVEIDGQGRVLLPQVLRRKFHLAGQVKVMAKGNFLAVHNLEMFEKTQPADGFSDEMLEAIDKIVSLSEKAFP